MMPSLIIDHLSINLRSGTDNLVSETYWTLKNLRCRVPFSSAKLIF